MAVTGQKVAAVMKKAGVSRGRWNASGRVKGWGTWMHGVRVEAVQEFDPKGGGQMRGKDGWQKNWDGTPRYRGAYRNTGTWKMDWCEGDRGSFPYDHVQMRKAVDAFRAAGCEVVDNGDGTYTVS